MALEILYREVDFMRLFPVAFIEFHSILDFERTRNQIQGSEFLYREMDLMRWFPLAFSINGAFIATCAGFELTTCVTSPHA